MLFYVYCLLCVCASFGKSVTQLSDVDFDDKVAKGTWMVLLVIVCIWSHFCRSNFMRRGGKIDHVWNSSLNLGSGHCKSLAPTFDELAKSASNQVISTSCWVCCGDTKIIVDWESGLYEE